MLDMFAEPNRIKLDETIRYCYKIIILKIIFGQIFRSFFFFFFRLNLKIVGIANNKVRAHSRGDPQYAALLCPIMPLDSIQSRIKGNKIFIFTSTIKL